jgi:hypothetical protein
MIPLRQSAHPLPTNNHAIPVAKIELLAPLASLVDGHVPKGGSHLKESMPLLIHRGHTELKLHALHDRYEI